MIRATAVTLILLLLPLTLHAVVPSQTQETETIPHTIAVGDTWTALSWRYDMPAEIIRAEYGHPNQQRQPVIGSTINLPVGAEQQGSLLRPYRGSLLTVALEHNRSPWQLALTNKLAHPYQPLLYQALYLPGGDRPPQELPLGFETLTLASNPATVGQALAFGALTSGTFSTTVQLNQKQWITGRNGRYLVAVGGTGAFYGHGQPELLIQPDRQPAWSQPLPIIDDEWQYQSLTYSGAAAAVTAAQIAAERTRLHEIWGRSAAQPLWEAAFQLPISDYIEITSPYGARRSYNDGPFSSYHEGWDFSAYRGAPIYAPAAGIVDVAEFLTARGGAVIIDHGLGIHSGTYHLSAIHVQAGTAVAQGDLIGEVGSTGLSTGNHLHWDMLVGTTWINPEAWLEQDMACWILDQLNMPCKTNA